MPRLFNGKKVVVLKGTYKTSLDNMHNTPILFIKVSIKVGFKTHTGRCNYLSHPDLLSNLVLKDHI